MKQIFPVYICVIIAISSGCSYKLACAHDQYGDLLNTVEHAELLLTKTYGPQNPFSELPLIIKSTYRRAQDFAHITKPIPETLARYISALHHTLTQCELALTALIDAYELDTFREPILAQLTVLCSESIDLLSQDPQQLDNTPNSKRTKKSKKHRFIPFISSSILVTTGKWIAASAVSVWLVYVLHKVYTYITLPNTELIEQAQNNQNYVVDKLRKVHNALTPDSPDLASNTTTTPAPWYKWGKKWKQWRARVRDRKILTQHTNELRERMSHTSEHDAIIREWEAAFKEIITTFPQSTPPR